MTMIARAEIWLGTLVEIALPEQDATEARFAAAFAAIAHVHRRMSAHDPLSDLAHIESDAHLRAVVVDAETHAVLRLAVALARETNGAFDPTLATPRCRSGGVALASMPGPRPPAFVASIILDRGNRVRTIRPLALDLGGIAKGYAVDRAVASLAASGASGGLVNAGGDLRAFGSLGWAAVRVRHPGDPALVTRLCEVRECAVATSADYFHHGGALLDPLTGARRPFGASITVVAPSCALADALTKIVAVDLARAARTLARYGAHAFRLEPCDGAVRATTTCAASTTRLRLAA